MTIKQFIEKAIEGGWKGNVLDKSAELYHCNGSLVVLRGWTGKQQTTYEMNLYEILLDLEAWKAVGKVEGWKIEKIPPPNELGSRVLGADEYISKMHQMIDALCEGKSAEDFIKTL